MSSRHFFTCLPRDLLPYLGCQSVILFVHLLSLSLKITRANTMLPSEYKHALIVLLCQFTVPLSLTHTHTHKRTLSLSLSLSLFHVVSFSLCRSHCLLTLVLYCFYEFLRAAMSIQLVLDCGRQMSSQTIDTDLPGALWQRLALPFGSVSFAISLKMISDNQ